SLGPDRLPRRLVQRHRGWTDREDGDGPGLTAAAADLGDRGHRVPRRDEDHALQAVGGRRAVVRDEAVIGLLHGGLERGRHEAGARPTSGPRAASFARSAGARYASIGSTGSMMWVSASKMR